MCDFLMHTIFLFAIACDFWHVLFCFSVNVYTSVTVSNFLAISLLRVIAYFFAFYFFEFTYRKKKNQVDLYFVTSLEKMGKKINTVADKVLYSNYIYLQRRSDTYM